MTSFDYIFTGAGCAGLSLLTRISTDAHLRHKRILLIDKSSKEENDRTWCFWQKGKDYFDPVVHHSWKQLSVYGDNFEKNFDIGPYQYKMIRGIDFYNHCLGIIRANPAVTIVKDEVLETGNVDQGSFVRTRSGTYTAEYVFNSILFSKPALKAKDHYLLQHFKGVVIHTQKPSFDNTRGTLMDFRISQEHGTSFVYVLPVSSTEALVEYTLFTGSLLADEAYDKTIHEYITTRLNIEQYEVISTEFGIIPMTNFKFPASLGNIINIGTAGGQTKPSSGYTFTFIQKHSEAIIALLRAGKPPVVHDSFSAKKFRWYDRTLLNILANRKLPGAFVFTELFRKNDIADVFSFLDNETTVLQDLKVVWVLPKWVFARASL